MLPYSVGEDGAVGMTSSFIDKGVGLMEIMTPRHTRAGRYFRRGMADTGKARLRCLLGQF